MLKTSILPEYDLVFPKNYLSEKKIPAAPPFFLKKAKKFNRVSVIIPGL